MNTDYDVIVIGGGPAGVAAASSAAREGARVGVIEADRLGGNCVNTSCIPTQIVLDVVRKSLATSALSAVGVVVPDTELRYGAVVARKDSLVQRMAQGIDVGLSQAGVVRLRGTGSFVDSHTVRLLGPDGAESVLSSKSFVIATGTTWEPPAISGVPPGIVATADVLLDAGKLPSRVVVMGDSPADFPFSVEYAFMLAAAGVETALVPPGAQVVPGLDPELDAAVVEMLEVLGCSVFPLGTITAGPESGVTLRSPGKESTWDPDVILVPDCRRPAIDALHLDRAGVEFSGGVTVDDQGRTSSAHIFGAGDVTGRWWHTAAAQRVGETVGRNAVGATDPISVRHVPRVLHSYPEIAWVGLTEDRAREDRAHGMPDVRVGYADLAWNAKAITGGESGHAKVILGPLGELVGVHAVGSGASEIVTVAAAFMQTESVAEEVAAFLPWHPSASEALVEAVRSALRSDP